MKQKWILVGLCLSLSHLSFAAEIGSSNSSILSHNDSNLDASKDHKNIELIFGTSAANITDTFSLRKAKDSTVNFHAALGVFYGAHLEPVLGFGISYADRNNEHFTSDAALYQLSPGVAYNFSEDFQNSWVIHVSAELYFSTNNYANSSPDSESGKGSHLTAGGSLTFGKRIKLGESISWYPRAFVNILNGAEFYNSSSPDESLNVSAGIIPLSLSITL